MRYFLIYSLLIFLLPIASVLAQDQCAIALSEAEDKYDQGKLYEIPEMLQSCLNDGFTKEEKVRAYRLLTLTYLFLDYYTEADSSYLKLLKLSPEYVTNDEIDPMEIINHHEKFTTKPFYYITMGKLGFNLSHANVLIDYSMSESNNGSDKYSSVVGFHAGFGAEMVLYQNLHLAGEFMISRKTLHLTDTHWGFQSDNSNFFTTNMDFAHTEIEIPVLLKYNFWNKRINPFVVGGIAPSYLFESNVQNIQRAYLGSDENSGEEFPVQSITEINNGVFKNRFNYSLLFGGGINYKVGLKLYCI